MVNTSTVLIAAFDAQLTAVIQAIATFQATGVLPVSYHIPTGHSVDAKDIMKYLLEQQMQLITLINQQQCPYYASVGG